MPQSIAIFGGGISGLTAAHILVLRGFDVTIYEAEHIIGGMARSMRESPSDVPTEHSWRGYAPFYRNLHHIVKQIPLPQTKDKSVADNLSDPINFHLLGSTGRGRSRTVSATMKDWIVLGYILGKHLFSDKRNKDKNYVTKIIPIFKKYASPQGYKWLIHFLMGPGWGMDKDTASIGHYLRFLDFSIFQSGKQTKWQVMSRPTQEAWFDPWKIFLLQKGVRLNVCTRLEQINSKDNIITSCVVQETNGAQYLVKANEYLFCLNPFNLEEILRQSHIPSLYSLQAKANNLSAYEMIAFAIPLQRKINWGDPNPAYILEDGSLNITFYPQDQIWRNGINLGKGVKSLWSGTCIVTRRPTDLYPNKTGIELSLCELRREIIHEFLSSEELQSLITQYNNTPLTQQDLQDLIIWYEWNPQQGLLAPKYKKYANNIYNQFNRMPQITSLSNGFISGAHTQTSIDIWSMEGAVESGILASNQIMNKYDLSSAPLYTHKRIKTPLHSIDNFLYTLRLPHVFDVILIGVIIFWLGLATQLLGGLDNFHE